VYLDWAQCAGTWCQLDELDLAKIKTTGVYIIWKRNGHVLRPATVVRVGHGDIATRLAEERANPAVSSHGAALHVTWAEVAAPFCDGVEVYLTRLLKPLMVPQPPVAATPVAVNLPVSA
jgi:hypothetical protein